MRAGKSAIGKQEKAVKPLARKLFAAVRTFGPYLALELVMPGGTLLALLLWLYRTHFHTSAERQFSALVARHGLRSPT
jgi:hypothetical protein